MCDMIGLYGRNIMYSFRRGAIVDTRHKPSTGISQVLTGHVKGGCSI
jgi:hypothetical protein